MTLGHRDSSERFGIRMGCCVCQTAPAGVSSIGLLMAADNVGRHVGLKRVEPHHAALRVVEGQRDEIHVRHPGQPLREILKQLMQVVAGRDHLGDFKQSAVLFSQSLAGGRSRSIHASVWPDRLGRLKRVQPDRLWALREIREATA